MVERACDACRATPGGESMRGMILVNLGCGPVWHPDWQNFDIQPRPPHVGRMDLRRPLPFHDATVDAVYHSHVLEHLPPATAAQLLRECHRVLRPGGVLRVGVPDLEGVTRAYLLALEAVTGGGDAFLHDWAVAELLDQCVREHSGGLMATLMREATPEQLAHIESRVGGEDARRARLARRERLAELLRGLPAGAQARWLLGFAANQAWLATTEALLAVVAGPRARRQLRVGRFRTSGEVHQWMYDRFSLERSLRAAGFEGVVVREPGESAIPGFGDHGLEMLHGRARKPESLYVEGFRPSPAS